MAQTINIAFPATTVAGTVNAITATYTPTLTGLSDKQTISFKATGPNTGAATFSPDSLEVKPLTKKGGTALIAGDIAAAGMICFVQYDATNNRWELINPASDANTPTNPTDTRLPYNNAGTFADSWLIHGANEVKILNGKFIEDEGGSIQIDLGGGFIFYAVTTDAGSYLTPYFYIDTNSAYMADATHGFFFGNFTAPGVTRFVHIRPAELELKHDVKIELDAPDVNLPQETASLILSTDASKNIKGLPTATYPSLAELARLKGITAFGQSLIDDATAADARATLGGTTIGQNVFTAADPSAIRFYKINADNTVSLRSELQLRQDLGLNTITLDSNQTTPLDTLVDITELVLALEANSEYEVDGFIRVGCDNTGGVFFAATVPTGTTFNINLLGISTAVTAFLTQNISLSGTAHGTAFNRFNSANFCRISGKIITDATAGNLQFQFASAVAGQTSTVYFLGSAIKITKIL